MRDLQQPYCFKAGGTVYFYAAFSNCSSFGDAFAFYIHNVFGIMYQKYHTEIILAWRKLNSGFET